jgi:copper chaperone CopZ
MKTNLNIKGMHCKSCVKLVESEFEGKVNSIKVEENGKTVIDFDDKKISLQKIKDTIKELGYVPPEEFEREELAKI